MPAALLVLSVAAVAELRSWPPQRLSGVDAGGGDASASTLVVARAHSALPALTPVFSEVPARSFSCCKNGRDDTPMSWWKHLENRFGMPFPPAVVLSSRACACNGWNSAYSSTPDQQGGVQFSLEIAPDARWPLLQHVPSTREVGGIAYEPRRQLCAGGSSFIARSGCTRGMLDSSNPPAHHPCS